MSIDKIPDLLVVCQDDEGFVNMSGNFAIRMEINYPDDDYCVYYQPGDKLWSTWLGKYPNKRAARWAVHDLQNAVLRRGDYKNTISPYRMPSAVMADTALQLEDLKRRVDPEGGDADGSTA